MSSYYEKFLKPCPVCDGSITDDSYDRGIRFGCKSCGYTKSYPGLIQSKVSSVPMPMVDGDGMPIDPKDVKHQEYYHQNANDFAVAEFNKWVDDRNSCIARNSKIEDVLKKSYVLNVIINGLTISVVGIFDNMEDLNKAIDKWESVKEINFEFYFNELEFNKDDLSMNPERHFTRSEMEDIPKDIIRDTKLNNILSEKI